ncbi:hypothetical protein [Desulfofustis limnaeus]|uniref:SGNH/GDSL hydrolase family protein n=1 Tax=Desulfofustis limnaeus TaxID=2740163 RepID=A0ABN6M739_9BACT|nr:hypothetical protein [Desulfofustis limnaeus]BDD87621.1 hypothetical protein DPPLL_19860 [Desulfofustis limnaeus]
MLRLMAIVREYRVLLLVGFMLVAVEGGVRLVEGHLSGNVNHILEIPAIVRQVEQARNDENTLVLLGNSLLNNATDEAVLRALLPMVASSALAKITPDGSALAEWFCVYNNHLAAAHVPDVLVIGFAWAQLSDQFPINASRLGGFFCGIDDSDRMGATGLTDHRNYLRFLAGKVSHVYVNRELIRNRLLSTVIPDYEIITQRLNSEERQRGGPGRTVYTYSLLTDLLASMHDAGTRVVLIAMPVQTPYQIDEGLLRETERFGVVLLDYRNLFNADEAVFADPIHLNSKGSKRFSTVLAGDLKPFLSQ